MKDFELTLRLKNNRLKQRREELGLSAHEIAVKAGISYNLWLRYEGLKYPPISTNRYGVLWWRKSALMLAKFFNTTPEELFPEAIRQVTQPIVAKKLSAQEVKKFLPNVRVMGGNAPLLLAEHTPESALENIELAELHALNLDCLEPYERKIICMSFGLEGYEKKTLNEMGALVGGPYGGNSRDRIRQMRDAALRKLYKNTKHNVGVKELEGYVDD